MYRNERDIYVKWILCGFFFAIFYAVQADLCEKTSESMELSHGNIYKIVHKLGLSFSKWVCYNDTNNVMPKLVLYLFVVYRAV